MRRIAAVLLALVVCAPAVGARPSEKPRLAVILAVDGLTWDRVNAWRPWWTSGLKRLLDEGVVSPHCNYRHLNTVTAPGHASIATGAVPRVHGIASNQWYVPSASGAGMEAVYSATQSAAGASEGASSVPGAGRLLVPSLEDRLVQRDPRSRVVAISNKDRAAILLAGRDARHAVYWYRSSDGTYETSAAYDAASPSGAAAASVVARFNQEKAGGALAGRFGATWSRYPVPSPAPVPGFASGLAAFQEPYVGPSFPHELTKSGAALPSAILASPFADRLLTDLALDLLADDTLALGRDDVPDVLAMSFSANDFVSHDYGPESVEALEVLRGLDRELGRLLDYLAKRFPDGSVMVALSADHGFLPLADAAKQRIPAQKIVDGLNAAVNRRLGRTTGPPLVYRLEGCSLWLDRSALAAPGAPDATRVLDIVGRELATTWRDAIARTFVESALPSDAAGDELSRDARNAFVPGRSGDLFVIVRSGAILSNGSTGTSHGSPWEYDTHVPLIFWGGGTKPRTLHGATTPYDLAPTLAAWLGVELPDATGHRLLN